MDIAPTQRERSVSAAFATNADVLGCSPSNYCRFTHRARSRPHPPFRLDVLLAEALSPAEGVMPTQRERVAALG